MAELTVRPMGGEAITITRRDGGFFLVDQQWPPVAQFSFEVIQQVPEVRLRGDLIHVKLTNARAVYQPIERDFTRHVFRAKLVYSEGPDVCA